jgi:ELP3 family radical SAM enzyme/protein acetyltransferase
MLEDIEEIGKISEKSDKRGTITKFVPEDNPILMNFVIDLEKNVEDKFKTAFIKLTRKYSILPNKRSMSMMYQYLVKNNIIEKNKQFESYIVKKASKSWSGVIVITIVMRPDQFSCPENCSYCPNQTKKNGALVDMPRSYLDSEPAVKRAVQHNFDTSAQFFSRVKTLEENGHTIDKAEIILEGGTFSSYSRKYQIELMRDIYYSANTYFDEGEKRNRFSLEEEITINESAKLKIIGITIETRPDHINKGELKRLRTYGVTRIQLGVQSIYDDVLDGVNRNHKVEHSIKAIKDCKDCGFKVDIHVMPDLPGTTFEKDMYMVEHILTSQDFMADYIKWYPCLDVDFTEIREWKKSGKWVPWADSDNGEKILQLGLKIKEFSKEYIRYNRIQRDFPEEHGNVVGYSSSNIKSNFRQMLHAEMKRRGLECKCIRCREVKDRVTDSELKNAYMKVDEYKASGGVEYFISYNSSDNKLLYGFVRLRVMHEDNNYFPELNGCALIRELHVYGSLKAVYDKGSKNTVQHYGFGKKLVERAEIIAKSFGYKKVAIISGVGVRNYYRNLGYSLQGSGQYMIKELVDENKRSYEILNNILYKYTDKICSVIYIVSLIYTLYFMIIDKVDKY